MDWIELDPSCFQEEGLASDGPQIVAAEAAVMVLYLALIATLLVPGSWIVAVIALLWYFGGAALQSPHGRGAALFSAAGMLLENIFQLQLFFPSTLK